MRIKSLLIYITLAVVNFIVNFTIYNYSFNSQATPFLHEEQRIDSGLLMLKTTFPAYVVSAIIITILFYCAAKTLKRKS
jgi:ABC-type uncharacterized transport system permease subunit